MSLRVSFLQIHKFHHVSSRFIIPALGCQCNSTQGVRWTSQSRKKGPKQAEEKPKWVSRAAKQREARKTVKRGFPNNWDLFLQRKIEDDVYIKNYFPPVKYSITEAIEMHREVAVPEMLDNMDGFLCLNAELNMKTTKKARFIAEFEGLLNMPHYFDDGIENKVLAFAKTKDEHRFALDEGAVFAGAADLIALIESGDVRTYMFDNVVCTVDFLEDIVKTRKHLREKFPNARSGAVGSDIVALVKKFRYGKIYKCEKKFDETAKIRVNIGSLNMETEQLVENFNAWVDQIHSHRSVARTKALGEPFFLKAFCTCSPSGEKIHIKEEQVLGGNQNDSRRQVTTEHDDDDDDDDDDEPEAVTAAK